MNARAASVRTTVGVAIVSAIQLAFEVLVIKLGRYEVGSLAIGTLGLAVLGVSLAAPLARLLGGDDRAGPRALALLLPVALAVGAWFFSREHVFHDAGSSMIAMAGCGAAALVLLALASVPVYAALVEQADGIPAIYGASLLGATLGAPASLLAMHAFGDVGAFAATGGSVGIAGAFLARTRPGRLRFLFAGVGVAVVACALFPRLDRAAHADAIRIRTDETSRIDVYRRPPDGLRFRTAGVNAGTSTAGGTVADPPRGLDHELASTPFRLRPRQVLVLGSGAGKNVVQSLAWGSARVEAVEINPMIPEAMRTLLPAARDPYRDPRVALVVAEGRQHAATRAAEGARFDLVYVPIATLFGSSGHAFTETYLMTREAFADYAAALAPRGVVATYFPSIARAKIVTALARALRARGIDDVAAHLVVVERDGAFVALARVGAPFDPDERSALLRPGASFVDVDAELRVGRTLRPLEDDDPFLYNDLDSASGPRALYGWNRRFLTQAAWVASAALVLLALVSWARPRSPSRAATIEVVAVFAWLGVGYTAHQTLVLQRLSFLVGHPVIATAIVLPATLAASALGATLAGRIPHARLGAFRAVAFATFLFASAPLVLISPTAWILPGWSILARSLVAALLAALVFAPLGTFFPLALARSLRRSPSLPPLAWIANGFGAVLGSIGAILGPMLHGFASTALVTTLGYAVVSTWDVAATRDASVRTAIAVTTALGLLLAIAAFALLGVPDGGLR